MALGETEILDPPTRTKLKYGSTSKSEKLQDLGLRHDISIIIPVYNEELKISTVLTHLKDVLNQSNLDYEIIVINDGSIDKTQQVVLQERELDSRVKLLTYEKNRGKGYAVRLGVLSSNGDVVLLLDGDLDISPFEIREYMNQIKGCDLVIASKAHPLSVVICPATRKFLSKTFSILVRLLVGIKIKDTQSGLKVGNGKALRRIFELMVVKRYAFDVELLA